jgi:hypothetical protein
MAFLNVFDRLAKPSPNAEHIERDDSNTQGRKGQKLYIVNEQGV